MIKLLIHTKNSYFSSFTIEGHSTLGTKGNNLLCAGVSTLSQGIFLGLTKILNLDLNYEKRDGYLFCQFPDDLSSGEQDKVSVLLVTLIETMKDLRLSFPDEIKIEWKET